ncbi:MAG: tetratricopeptide repeat protein [Kofleriaceae bacterium]
MKTNIKTRWLGFSSAIALVVACGGSAQSGLGKGGGVPPPPQVGAATAGSDGPKREISNDARKDYEAAMQTFAQTEKSGSWNDSSCRSTADRFESVARSHSELVEAQFMAGLSYHRCGMVQEAEKAYQAASRMKGDPKKIAFALSNLGELYYRAGKVDGAKQYWESAIKANPKLIAARINIASMQLEQMRKVGYKDPSWAKLDDEARFNLSNALGVDSENVHAYTVFGLIYLEGYQKNKNRLDLAKVLLDEAKKRNEKYAPLQNAYGLYYMRRNALSEALKYFQAAVEADPKFAEARQNVGNITLNFRNYTVAKEQFSKALELQPKSYDATIGLGIALRGLKDFDGAEAQYKKARELDSRRGAAYYNLAVLYKDFRASKQEMQESLSTYAAAKDYFRQFLDKAGDDEDKAEAKEQIKVIDKTTAQISNFLKAQASQPPAAPAPK